MNRTKFNQIVDRRIELTRNVLQKKGAEYASNTNVFENFEKAKHPARVDSREAALWGMAMKHFVSIGDMVQDTESNPRVVFHPNYIEEKIGDMINYLILLEGMLKENSEKLTK